MQRQMIYVLLIAAICVVAACKGKKEAQVTPPPPPVVEVEKPKPPPPPPEVTPPKPPPPKPEPPKPPFTKSSLEHAFNTYDANVLNHFAGPNVNVVVLSNSGGEVDRFTARDYVKRLGLLKRYIVTVVDYQTNTQGKITLLNVKEQGKN